MDLDAVADELYGLPPAEFTASRDRRAAEAGRSGDRALAKSIRALRRPTLAAWACNLLARQRPEEVELLTALGEGLRQAHRELDGARLRELSRRQRVLVDTLARQAGQLAAEAGQRIGDSPQREVAATLHAVLADPQAAEEWAGGRLVTALASPAGFPAVDSGTVRRLPSAPDRERAPGREATVSELDAARDRRRQREAEERATRARHEARKAEQELHAREGELDRRRDEADEARQALAETERGLEDLEHRLKDARARHRAAAERARQTDRSLEQAEQAAREARRRTGTSTPDDGS
ncbi:hypothetical protein [Streptomyces sp. ISL-11]|uniref:hypothetical protein n=1 Tax=Streptomyces sp. ISL-11 TaxID=2819174 RepID=UPI001BE69667|nr:hypothetical protein [Streptomyces sp. ISL-11]MBT2382189.1 hypothetical protein [Streptomyces sp. ISL-11]